MNVHVSCALESIGWTYFATASRWTEKYAMSAAEYAMIATEVLFRG
jgi:hypothetical protein